MGAVDKYLEFLWNCFQSDMGVFSNTWIYYTIIPAIGYFIFFLLKWAVLTAPLWLPISIIIRVFNLPSPKCEGCLYKSEKELDETAFPKKKKESEEHTHHNIHSLLN